MFGVVCGFPAVFAALSLFYAYLARTLRVTRFLADLHPRERSLYLSLLAAFLVFTAVVFIKSDCFYSGGDSGITYNIIYSCDCGLLAETYGSVFLNLRHPSTQGYMHAMLAPFSAPFAGLPALLAAFFPGVSFLWPLLLQGVQLFLMLLIFLMLARLMELTGAGRAWFALLCFSAYPALLSAVAVEKFVIAAFWSVLFLYASREKGRPDPLAISGAGGCVACGVFLLPLSTLPLLRQEPRRWLLEMLRGAGAYLLALTALGRLDSLLAPFSIDFGPYFGLTYSLSDRARQYTAFVSSCFFAPAAGPAPSPQGWASWWTRPAGSVSVIGLVLLALCAAGFWTHRREFAAQAAAGWASVSFVLFFLLGFNLVENSLVLFSFYFGWSFWVLLFFPMRDLWKKRPFPAAVLSGGTLCLLLARNIPQMAALLRFAVETYPAAW